MRGKYRILCNASGGIMNDPVLLRLFEDESWFSTSADMLLWLQCINIARGWYVDCRDRRGATPCAGPLSEDLIAELVGDEFRQIPYYGMRETRIAGCPVVVSQTGFTGRRATRSMSARRRSTPKRCGMRNSPLDQLGAA